MKTIAKTLLAAGLAASLGTAALAADQELNFGIISTESTANLKPQWDPFLKAMSDQTGYKVNAFFASDYAGIIEGMRFKKVDVAWYGNASAIEAVDRANGEVFTQTVDGDGNPGYWSLLVTHVDNKHLNSLDDVLKCDKSLTFGIGDPNSTSGFLVPTTFLFASRGIDPKQCYSRVTNASHEVNALSAANKQVDFAANNTENMRRLEKTNPTAAKNLKIIWQSPLIPSDPLVWRKDLDSDMKAKVYTFVMSYGRMGTPEEVAAARKVLAGLQWAPFKPSSDAQLYPIRVLAISKDIAKIQNDQKYTADEKKAKLTALEAQKKKYEMLMAQVPQS